MIYIIKLSLFIASKNSPIAQNQITNVKKLLNSLTEEVYELNIYELFEDWQKAKDVNIITTPTLIKQTPKGESRLIGDFSNKKNVLNFLSIE